MAVTLSANTMRKLEAALKDKDAAKEIADLIAGATDMNLSDGTDITLGSTTGSKIGTAITEKLGFYNATPIAQRSGAAQAAVATTGATNSSPYGFTTAAQADAIVTLVNELRAWAVAQGFIKGSA